jgi:DNA-binding MarR family transcriptional regulator
LSVLVFAGRSLSLRELAEAEQVKAPTMSRIVSGMMRAGLAKTYVSREDRRRLVISASKKGTAVLQKGRQRRVKALEQALKELSPAQLRQLGQSVELVMDATKRI